MAHVVERVFLLRGGQRAPRPVGARVRLGQVDAEQAAHELRVTHLRRMAGERGGDLRVEHRLHQPDGREQHLEVLACGMHDLHDAGRGEQRHEGGEVRYRQRVDAYGRIAVGDLHQAQLGPVGLFAHELGVE